MAVVAAIVGWFGAVVVLRRRDDPADQRPASGTDPLARAILAQTRTGYAVIDDENHVLLSNGRAVELGVVRAGFADPRILDAAARALVSGEPVDVDLTDRSTRGIAPQVHAEVRQIDASTVLVIAADESAAVRTEAVRRDFVANVSHELKTPIGAISLLAEAVLDGADDADTVRHFTAKITKESQRLATLVSELIALSKLQGGADSADLAPVSVDTVIDEVISRTLTIADAVGIAVGVGGRSGHLRPRRSNAADHRDHQPGGQRRALLAARHTRHDQSDRPVGLGRDRGGGPRVRNTRRSTGAGVRAVLPR